MVNGTSGWLRHFALGPAVWRSLEQAEKTEPLDQSRWQWGVVASAKFVDNTRGMYGPVLAMIFAVIGLFVVPGHWYIKVPLAALIGLVIAWSVPTLVAVGNASVATRTQLGLARDELSTKKRTSDLIELDDQLRRHRKSNSSALFKIRDRSGALPDDADPWIRSQNEQLRSLVEGCGLPELVSRLTLENPHLSTWEEVRQAATKLDDKIGDVLNDPLFSDVHHLAEIGKERRANEAIEAIAANLATELRDIRRKIEKVKSMASQIYWEGFELPAARWDEYDKALALRPDVYAVVEAAYVAANDVNEAIRHRLTVARSRVANRLIGPSPTDGLDTAYDLAGKALDVLGQARGVKWETPEQEIAGELILDSRLALLRELVREGETLYDTTVETDAHHSRWIADHYDWRERIKNELPDEDKVRALNFSGLAEPPSQGEKDVVPAKARIDRILGNLRDLHDEYHRGAR